MADESHERRCWDCGNVAVHEDSITPHVLCKKCGSQDTRRVKAAVASKPSVILDPYQIANIAEYNPGSVVHDLCASHEALRAELEALRNLYDIHGKVEK